MAEMKKAIEDFQEAMKMLSKNNPEVMRDFKKFIARKRYLRQLQWQF